MTSRKHITKATEGGYDTNTALEHAKTGKGVATPDKGAAKPLSDSQALGKVIAAAIVTHLDGGERGIFAEFMRLDKADRPCKVSALGEINAQRKARIEAAERDYEGDFLTRKVNSIRASFSRILVVIEAMLSEVNIFDFTGCESYADMVAVARTFSTGKGKNNKTMNASGYESWSDKVSRIVDTKHYDPKSDNSVAQVARLEKFMVKAIKAYANVAKVVPGLRYSVKDLEACVTPKVIRNTRHIRRAA